MYGECHAHLFMNGANYREAVALHKEAVNKEDIQNKLKCYQEKGITFLRDGGDMLGVSEYAAQIAGEYGIDYRTPVFAIHKNGHYGKIVGHGFDTMKEYKNLVEEAISRGADFIKVMFSGIMDFAKEGELIGEPLEKSEIAEMIHIAHDSGMAVMAHVNGADTVRIAAESGVDSVEHGNFVDGDSLQAMKENHTIWVPTFVTITNLIGSGRFDDAGLKRRKQNQGERIRQGAGMGVMIALGSDAGAYRVDHVKGIQDEHRELSHLLQDYSDLEERFQKAEQEVKKRFQTQK